MCFSAEASFTAAAGLLVIGSYLGYKFKGDRKFLLAVAPCFFALQQFLEGVLWVSFNQGAYGTSWSIVAQEGYLFFAFFFWPLWVPIAFFVAEKDSVRKLLIGAFFLIGMTAFLWGGVNAHAIHAQVVEHSIQYGPIDPFLKAVYAFTVLIPFLLTSIPRMWVLALLGTIAFFVADYAYTYAFASVWCFAGAVISAGLLWVLLPKDRQRCDV